MRKKIPSHKRVELLEKWEHRCAYCGVAIAYETCQIDHGVPLQLQHSVSALGSNCNLPSLDLNDDWNLFPACRECNNWNGGMTILGFRQELAKQVERCQTYSRNFRIALRFELVDIISRKANFIMDGIADPRVVEFSTLESHKRAGNSVYARIA